VTDPIHGEPGVVIRDACVADLAAVVSLYADDAIGASREAPGQPLDPAYVRGFAAIEADPRSRLIVAEVEGRVVGTLQLTYLPGVNRRGAERAQIEAAHVAGDVRNRRIGRRLVAYALTEARAHGAVLAQLTTDGRRGAAHRFWLSCGFEASHIGMKQTLSR